VLVIHQGALGDFILTFPALERLNHDIGPVDVLCRSGFGRVACRLNLAERYHSLDAAIFVSLFSDALEPPAEPILKAYDTILLISFSESVETILRCDLPARIFRVPPRPSASGKIHAAEFIVNELESVGLVKPLRMEVDAKIRPGCRDRRGVDHKRILLHPGAGSQRKRWPLSHYKAIFNRLNELGMEPVPIIGPAEQDLAPRISSGWENAQPLIISDLDLLMDTLETSGGLIGNDSGVSHLSAWLGVPTVTCFGPTDPACWRPLGPCVSVVQPRWNDSVDKGGINGSGHSLTELADISPEAVFEAFWKLWKESPPINN